MVLGAPGKKELDTLEMYIAKMIIKVERKEANAF